MNNGHEIAVGIRHAPGDARQPLAERIGCHLESKLCGQIHYLQVVCSDGLLILRGRTRTYHVKQMAHQAALELTDGFPLLINQIVVS
jgi:hypothetical protein